MTVSFSVKGSTFPLDLSGNRYQAPCRPLLLASVSKTNMKVTIKSCKYHKQKLFCIGQVCSFETINFSSIAFFCQFQIFRHSFCKMLKCWFIQFSVQTFQPLIVIYRRGFHWRCTQIFGHCRIPLDPQIWLLIKLKTKCQRIRVKQQRGKGLITVCSQSEDPAPTFTRILENKPIASEILTQISLQKNRK